MHRWQKDKREQWEIYCGRKEAIFSPKCTAFKERGECPYCKIDAKTELEIIKRVKKEEQRRKEMEKEIAIKNTLGGYF